MSPLTPDQIQHQPYKSNRQTIKFSKEHPGIGFIQPKQTQNISSRRRKTNQRNVYKKEGHKHVLLLLLLLLSCKFHNY